MGQKLIVVTGGAGFIGSHLCRRLAEAGHRVISLDNYFAGSRGNHVPGVEYRTGHTKDIEKHIPEHPDIVYHLGEYARVEQSVLEPDVVYDLNIAGTAGVLQFWTERRFKLVYAGSSTKFGDGGRARGATPYAWTKAENTERVKKLGDKEKLPYAITYFYNVYGPGERAGLYGTVIEAFKQMYLSGVPLAVVAPGTQQRNFTHVDDIVDGLVLIGERGEGDEYGLGNEKSFSILDVARMFGGDIVMLPERAGNRMTSDLDLTKASVLGWKPKRSLPEYIHAFTAVHRRGIVRERRVLVLSTTLYPTVGPAEEALLELVRKMPDVQFDVVAARFSGRALPEESRNNLHIYRVGFGHPFDKYILPFLGFLKGRRLYRKHRYLFTWSLMASYAALAGVLLKRAARVPLLITLADQRLETLAAWKRLLLRLILSDADQVYGMHTMQEKDAARIAGGILAHSSLGGGDAFANQLRYAYADILLNRSRQV